MDKAIIHPHAAGKALPPAPPETQRAYLETWPRWSLGVRTANLIFLSGMGGIDEAAVPQHVDDPAAQVQVTMGRIVQALETAGGRAADIAKVRIFLDNPANGPDVLRGVDEFLAATTPGRYPAVCMVVANTSTPEIHTEIEVVAATGHESVATPLLDANYSPLAATREHAHAVRVGSMCLTSGILPTDKHGVVVGTTAAEQTDRAVANLEAVLATCSLRGRDLAKLTVWIDRADDVGPVCDRLRAWLHDVFSGGDAPAATVMIAPLAQPGMRVQLEAIASSAPRRCVDAGVGGTTDLLPASDGVIVALESDEGSYLRRFTWPDHPTDLDPTLHADLSPHQGPLGHLLFLSGQAGIDRNGVLANGMAAQTLQTFENMRAIAEAAGATFADLVQFDVYYRERSLYADYNRVRIDYLERHNPDKEWFAGSGPKAISARPGALIEMESIAIVPTERTRMSS